ncbi:hypothetical protein SeMB42_g02752 [Synchytrium endobioticum]|uniref:Uncharacterized protein n=1 Tax=Synchytrium endobioticum TaxID=286115 RepID=A0A507DDW1_9FUNG|nr:hypothetical protein SeMB42_g02752 [Synchytrium endobioticum]
MHPLLVRSPLLHPLQGTWREQPFSRSSCPILPVIGGACLHWGCGVFASRGIKRYLSSPSLLSRFISAISSDNSHDQPTPRR